MLDSKNRLIEGLADVHEHLRPRSAMARMPAGKTVYGVDGDVDRVFLIEDGVAAFVWPDSPSAIDIAMVGPEGMIGAGASFGGPRTLFAVVARTPLTLLGVPTMVFDEAVSRSPELKTRVLNFVGALVKQVADTAHANARLSVGTARRPVACHGR